MNPRSDDDQMALLSQYYPVGIIDQFVLVPEHGAVDNVKPRQRRRKNKSNDGSGGGDGLMRKRKLSEDQVIMLEKSFGSEHKLETERKDQLAAELGLDSRQVAVWFQNRRARWKSKKLEEEYNKLRREHESTVVEKCLLEAEDERELKRQKRKQSNRESAPRSRLRKQAECEELQQRVEMLSNEKGSLGDELQRLSEESDKFISENNSIKEPSAVTLNTSRALATLQPHQQDELTRLLGPDSVSKLENGNTNAHHQSRGDEGNC